MTRSVTAVFDSTEAAERAAHDLATRIGGVRGTIYSSANAGDLDRLGLPGEDRATLGEHTRRGGVVFHAEVPDEKFAAVCDVLEAAGAQDFDEIETRWRSEGWSAQGSTASQGTGAMGSTASGGTGGLAASGTASQAASGLAVSGTTSQSARALDTGTEERIPVVEEQLRIAKRETEHGRVRIRSYVVETPVQEQVTLHEERVSIERRPVDRPLGAADEAAFRDRTIEATETAEEAVVSKEARVKEEVVVRKQAEERTETISDTVRRTEVEVEDERRRTRDPERR